MGHGDEFRPPLPPEDRLWRHPSEVAAAARARPMSPPSPRARVSVATVAVSALIGATLSLGIVAALGGFDERVVEKRFAVEPADGAEVAGTMAAVADRTAPSVVGVTARHGEEWTEGNAIILRSDGYLVTTVALIADAEDIEVHLPPDSTYDAEVVGVDPLTDVAVLRIDGGEYTPATIGSSADLTVGDDALAIGLRSPGRWQPVLTTCVISALSQRLDHGNTTYHGMVLLNSGVPSDTTGSPVVDHRGAVIGLVSTLVADVAEGENVTPVVPIDDAVDVADEIIEYGHARHVWLGVGGRDLDRQTAEEWGIVGGASLSEVVPDSPAERSGLAPGDVITGLDDAAVASMTDLVLALRDHEPGETVTLTVTRDGESTTVHAELAERDP